MILLFGAFKVDAGKEPVTSNSGLTVKEKVAVTKSALFQPGLLAVAFIVQVLLMLKGPLYKVAESLSIV